MVKVIFVLMLSIMIYQLPPTTRFLQSYFDQRPLHNMISLIGFRWMWPMFRDPATQLYETPVRTVLCFKDGSEKEVKLGDALNSFGDLHAEDRERVRKVLLFSKTDDALRRVGQALLELQSDSNIQALEFRQQTEQGKLTLRMRLESKRE